MQGNTVLLPNFSSLQTSANSSCCVLEFCLPLDSNVLHAQPLHVSRYYSRFCNSSGYRISLCLFYKKSSYSYLGSVLLNLIGLL